MYQFNSPLGAMNLEGIIIINVTSQCKIHIITITSMTVMAGDLCYCAVYRNDSRKKMTRWHARHKSQILTSHEGRSRSKYHKAVH